MSNYLSTKDILLRTPVPIETNTYKPVSHRELMDLTLEGLHKAGFQVERELYSSAREGNIGMGRYFIKDVSDDEMQLQISWRNSYDKSLALTFAVGCNVLVCTNGMMAFRSATSFKRKHTGDVQIFTPSAITEDIISSGDIFRELQKDRDAMKQIPVNTRLIAELLGRMYIEDKIIESTELNIIKREIEKPSYNYTSEGSLWELYQYTTFAIGGVHPSRWVQDHLNAHSFFSNVMKDITEEVEEVV